MATYVLVHGGGHGGWCYQRVARLLRSPGHEVYTPTLTGLGERSHLLDERVDLNRHIEDVAVRKGYQGRGVGSSLVKSAVEMARELGCYKCILDCGSELVGFYEGVGFSRHDVGMRIDIKPSRRRA